jgi:FkbM family methyltransferase
VGAARLLSRAAHDVQRRLRPAAPALTARLTWALKRRQGAASLAVVDALVGPGDAIVDAGANWGLFAARLAQLAGRGGQVDAFEPHPAHAATLGALARSRPQLAVHAVALSSAPGRARLHVPIVDGRRVTALASLGAPAGGGEHEVVEVPVVTLDAALAGRRPPSFVKIDVEGLELEVLRGAGATLRAAHPALLVEIEQRHSAAPIAATLEHVLALGYAGHYFGPDGLTPLDRFDVERDQLAHLGPGVAEYGMPAGYVADFLFTGPAVDVERLRRVV